MEASVGSTMTPMHLSSTNAEQAAWHERAKNGSHVCPDCVSSFPDAAICRNACALIRRLALGVCLDPGASATARFFF